MKKHKSSCKFKNAFTLIEVMVAVMIISVVIIALMKMYANNTHIFSILKNDTKLNQSASLLIANENYGFENKNIYLYDLVKEFDLEHGLRRELKETKAKIIYQELQIIDLSEQEEGDSSEDTEGSNNIVFEVGKSILKTDKASVSMIRLKIQ